MNHKFQPLRGLRVVELSTVIFVPSAAQYLALLGATVIKVEDVSGDPLRGLMKPFQPERNGKKSSKKAQNSKNYQQYPNHSSLFDGVNRCKHSLCLDLKKKQGRQAFFDLLSCADVFMTSVREEALCKTLGILNDKKNNNQNKPNQNHIRPLDILPEIVHNPHLIIAQGSAYSTSNTNNNGIMDYLPGFDVLSFWSSTGMCTLFHGSQNAEAFERAGSYPLGFGDVTCGLAMAGGIMGSLFEKRGRMMRKQQQNQSLINNYRSSVSDSNNNSLTDSGFRIDVSLFGTGIWVLKPAILEIKPKNSEKSLSMNQKNQQQYIRFSDIASQTQFSTNIPGITICFTQRLGEAESAVRLARILGLSDETTFIQNHLDSDSSSQTQQLSEIEVLELEKISKSIREKTKNYDMLDLLCEELSDNNIKFSFCWGAEEMMGAQKRKFLFKRNQENMNKLLKTQTATGLGPSDSTVTVTSESENQLNRMRKYSKDLYTTLTKHRVDPYTTNGVPQDVQILPEIPMKIQNTSSSNGISNLRNDQFPAPSLGSLNKLVLSAETSGGGVSSENFSCDSSQWGESVWNKVSGSIKLQYNKIGEIGSKFDVPKRFFNIDDSLDSSSIKTSLKDLVVLEIPSLSHPNVAVLGSGALLAEMGVCVLTVRTPGVENLRKRNPNLVADLTAGKIEVDLKKEEVKELLGKIDIVVTEIGSNQDSSNQESTLTQQHQMNDYLEEDIKIFLDIISKIQPYLEKTGKRIDLFSTQQTSNKGTTDTTTVTNVPIVRFDSKDGVVGSWLPIAHSTLQGVGYESRSLQIPQMPIHTIELCCSYAILNAVMAVILEKQVKQVRGNDGIDHLNQNQSSNRSIFSFFESHDLGTSDTQDSILDNQSDTNSIVKSTTASSCSDSNYTNESASSTTVASNTTSGSIVRHVAVDFEHFCLYANLMLMMINNSNVPEFLIKAFGRYHPLAVQQTKQNFMQKCYPPALVPVTFNNNSNTILMCCLSPPNWIHLLDTIGIKKPTLKKLFLIGIPQVIMRLVFGIFNFGKQQYSLADASAIEPVFDILNSAVNDRLKELVDKQGMTISEWSKMTQKKKFDCWIEVKTIEKAFVRQLSDSGATVSSIPQCQSDLQAGPQLRFRKNLGVELVRSNIQIREIQAQNSDVNKRLYTSRILLDERKSNLSLFDDPQSKSNSTMSNNLLLTDDSEADDDDFQYNKLSSNSARNLNTNNRINDHLRNSLALASTSLSELKNGGGSGISLDQCLRISKNISTENVLQGLVGNRH